MNSVLLPQNKLEQFLLEGLKDLQFNNTDSHYTFNTTVGLVHTLKIKKKKGACQYSTLRGNLHDFCNSGIFQLDLDQYEIVQALEDPEFMDTYTSHAMNPFDIAKVLSIVYNDNCWGDKDELIKQI